MSLFLTPEVMISQKQWVFIQSHSPGCGTPGKQENMPALKPCEQGNRLSERAAAGPSTELLQHFTAGSGKGRRHSAMMLFPLVGKTDPQLETGRVMGICRF